MPTATPLNGLKVLVVEDDEATRYAWCKYLALAGAAVTSAEDGQQALQTLRGNALDVVLVDLVLPDMDGFGVLAQSQSRSQQVLAIAVTAFDDEVQRRYALSAGFAAYLVKPVYPSALVEEITRLMGSR